MRGDGRGRHLGFPTANLQLAADLETGIFVGWARILPTPEKYPALVHIGARPTFGDQSHRVEVHLLDLPYQELYGAQLAFYLLKKIRPIEHFDTAQALIEKMAGDRKAALELLAALETGIEKGVADSGA